MRGCNYHWVAGRSLHHCSCPFPNPAPLLLTSSSRFDITTSTIIHLSVYVLYSFLVYVQVAIYYNPEMTFLH